MMPKTSVVIDGKTHSITFPSFLYVDDVMWYDEDYFINTPGFGGPVAIHCLEAIVRRMVDGMELAEKYTITGHTLAYGEVMVDLPVSCDAINTFDFDAALDGTTKQTVIKTDKKIYHIVYRRGLSRQEPQAPVEDGCVVINGQPIPIEKESRNLAIPLIEGDCDGYNERDDSDPEKILCNVFPFIESEHADISESDMDQHIIHGVIEQMLKNQEFSGEYHVVGDKELVYGVYKDIDQLKRVTGLCKGPIVIPVYEILTSERTITLPSGGCTITYPTGWDAPGYKVTPIYLNPYV